MQFNLNKKKKNRKNKAVNVDSLMDAFNVKKNLGKLKGDPSEVDLTSETIDSESNKKLYKKQDFISSSTPTDFTIPEEKFTSLEYKLKYEMSTADSNLKDDLTRKIDDVNNRKVNKNNFRWIVSIIVGLLLALLSAFYFQIFIPVKADVESHEERIDDLEYFQKDSINF